jgi:hypothetical protein
VLPEEVDDIDEADGVYVVELKLAGDFQARELLVTVKEFTDKVVTPSGKKLDTSLKEHGFFGDFAVLLFEVIFILHLAVLARCELGGCVRRARRAARARRPGGSDRAPVG